MILFEEEIRNEHVKTIAQHMLIAARTAPKARGVDNLILAVVGKQTIKKISTHLHAAYERTQASFLYRDAENINLAEYIVLLGTKNSVLGLDCKWCGFESCAEKITENPKTPCIFNTHDLGIAVGSAVSCASSFHVDNRLMYSVGMAAMEIGILGKECVCAFGIPLSASAKNPFFDRPNPFIVP